MDTTRIDLNLLLTLEALLAEQNVTKAAVRLHLSQPAVSAQLNRLRDLFDDPLLIPARRGMTPTAKALELIIPVRESLEKLRHTLQSHKDFHPERAKLTVAISCTDYTQAAIVMPLVLALREQAPGVRIAVRPTIRCCLNSNWRAAKLISRLRHKMLRKHTCAAAICLMKLTC